MRKSHKKVVVDTNVMLSDIVFGGKPRVLTALIVQNTITAYTSPDLLAELLRILKQKFLLTAEELRFIETKMKKNFKIVYPKRRMRVLKDEPDNRVLETALEGNCDFIVTGDKDLLKLGKYKNIEIISINYFLDSTKKNSQPSL